MLDRLVRVNTRQDHALTRLACRERDSGQSAPLNARCWLRLHPELAHNGSETMPGHGPLVITASAVDGWHVIGARARVLQRKAVPRQLLPHLRALRSSG